MQCERGVCATPKIFSASKGLALGLQTILLSLLETMNSLLCGMAKKIEGEKIVIFGDFCGGLPPPKYTYFWLKFDIKASIVTAACVARLNFFLHAKYLLWACKPYYYHFLKQ